MDILSERKNSQNIKVENTPKRFSKSKLKSRKETHMKKKQPAPSTPSSASVTQMASLSNEEIFNRVQRDPLVQSCEEEIQYWCKIVFGNAYVLQYRIEDMQKIPEIGEELSWQISENPHFFHKLAGSQTLGIKNSARKEAEAGISSLCNAIETYADTVKQVRKSIVQAHQAQQNRQELSSEPSQDLQKQQSLSKPPKLPEHSPEDRHQESTESSMQAKWNRLGARPRTVPLSQKTQKQQEQLGLHQPIMEGDGKEAAKVSMSAIKATKVTTKSEALKAVEQLIQPPKVETAKVVSVPLAQEAQKTLIEKETIPSLTNEEVASKIRESEVVKSSMQKIKTLCGVVYGNPHILEGKMPKMGIPVTNRNVEELEKFARQVGSFPSSFGRVAGFSFLGIKSGARAHAEENFLPLSHAIVSYTHNVKQAEKDILEAHSGKQERYAQSVDTPSEEIQNLFSLTQETQKMLIEKETLPPLSYVDVASKIRESEVVKSSKQKIETLCKVVYGNPRILEDKMPKMGIPVTNKNVEELEKFARQVGNFPSSCGKIVGFNFLGIKSEARAHAEENFLPLSHAIFSYAHSVKQAEKDILEAYFKEQERCAQSVETPSEEITNLLSFTQEQQKEILSNSPKLRTQVKAYSQKLHNRLSPNDLQAISERSHTKLAESLGTSVNQAEKIAQILTQTKDVVQILQQQEQRGLRQSIMKGDGRETAKVNMSAIKATEVTTKFEASKAVEQAVQPPKVETAKVVSVSFTQEAQKMLIEKEIIPPLSYVDVASKIRESEVVKSSMQKIKTLCGVVYGNPDILEGKMPKMGIPVTNKNVEELEKFARQVGNFPSSCGKIVGFSFLGIKSEARAHAEENFLPLSHAIFSYAHNVKQAEKDILEAYFKEQERCAQSVETPSEEITNLLSFTQEQQKEVLLTSPKLRTQVKAYSQKLHNRLSPNDLQAISERSHTKLAESLGTSVNQAEKIAQILTQTKDVVQILQQQEQLGLYQSIMKGDGRETAKVNMSAIKATQMTTKVTSLKAVEQIVRPPKVETAKVVSMSR
ncbi:T4SS effector BepG [Bartonella henselae]|uniref:T4SS effector BepG n=1 Tax=Bartonella henselae TaxID=38323 RepID=UPI0025AA8510|nr:T4SS effector BepG [Bartonella henselae]MDM9995042.1 T4SS effector BepG [Bartonella henselae]